MQLNMSVASSGPGEGHMKFGKIGLVSDGLGGNKSWCGLIWVGISVGVGWFRLG